MLLIRAMELGDKKEVMKMVDEFYHSDAVDHEVDIKILERSFMDAVGEEPTICGAVLCEGDEIVGFGYLAMSYSCEVGGKVVMMEELFLKDSCRGKGYGKKYFNWVFETHPEAVRFRLEVTKANTGASALYKRLGFEYLDYDQMIYDRNI